MHRSRNARYSSGIALAMLLAASAAAGQAGSDTCDLSDAEPVAPYPYCGSWSAGLTLRPAMDGFPDLLGFVAGADVVWLDAADLSQEAGRCRPDWPRGLFTMAYNEVSICDSSDTFFASSGSGHIVEFDANVADHTTTRYCGGAHRDVPFFANEFCSRFRDFRFAGLSTNEFVRALAVAEPPSLGRKVLVVLTNWSLFFVAGCKTDLVDVVHRCSHKIGGPEGIDWIGGDQFVVAAHGQTTIVDISNGSTQFCEAVGNFRTPTGIVAAAFDRDRDVLVTAEDDGHVLHELSLDPIDHGPVASISFSPRVGDPPILECGGGEWLSGRSSCDPDDPVNYLWTTDTGSSSRDRLPSRTLSLGTQEVELRVDDGRGSSDTARIEVSVIDTRPPSIEVNASHTELWPPDGALVPVALEVSSIDFCDREIAPVCEIVSVSSSQAAGSREPDWEIRSALEVALRAERDGDEDRVDEITVE
jgi:hypothetical protein